MADSDKGSGNSHMFPKPQIQSRLSQSGLCGPSFPVLRAVFTSIPTSSP